jgi:hypothetical protein
VRRPGFCHYLARKGRILSENGRNAETARILSTDNAVTTPDLRFLSADTENALHPAPLKGVLVDSLQVCRFCGANNIGSSGLVGWCNHPSGHQSIFVTVMIPVG